MARRKVAYRRPYQNRFSMFLVTLVVMMIAAVVSVKSMQLTDKLDTYAARQEQLDRQIAAEEARTIEIEEYRKYTQTKKYVEEVAKNQLGLVYDDEILFKQEEE